MDEEEKKSLEEEKEKCLQKLWLRKVRLDELTRLLAECRGEYLKWKKKYEEVDMALALEDKLTIVKRGRKSETADSLEAVLKDKEKVKKLMMLLREEADELTPNVSFTTT